MSRLVIIFCISLLCVQGFAKDRKDTAIYETKNIWGKDKDILTTDMSSFEYVRDYDAYNPIAHTAPLRQDTTGTCWCFSGTSFLESELVRLGYEQVELSRMHTVYWEYVEKCRYYVETKGESLVAEGSEFEALLRRIKQCGMVRRSDYNGLLNGETVYNHRELIKEINTYLAYVKKNELWYEDQVLQNVRAILNRYLGCPPETITVDGKELTPQQYLASLPIDPDNYVQLISFNKFPFWTKQKYDVPDNYWDSENYFNVPLDVFYSAVKSAIQAGYPVGLAGDVSEPGKYGWKDIAIIPSFDIPSSLINQDSREFRFYNKTSTDDHGVLLIGYKKFKGEDWFLIKDSASSAWSGDFPGYHFFSSDYLKLKILSIMIHKDAIPEILKKFN